MIIYKITNKINGKLYVGQTIRPLKRRIWNHLCKTGTAISSALRKYGIENFVIEEIDRAETKEELNKKEQY